MTKERSWLFFGALVQVLFVSMNVVFITRGYIGLMALGGFAISLLWALNVKKISISGWTDRLIYASGASVGTVIGYLFSKWLVDYLI